MERGGRDGEGREGRGSDEGGGSGGAGPSLLTAGAGHAGVGGCRRPSALAIRRWGCCVGGRLLLFVGFLFVGAKLSFVGGGARSRAVHIREWGVVVM
jgi:hypothetical protein